MIEGAKILYCSNDDTQKQALVGNLMYEKANRMHVFQVSIMYNGNEMAFYFKVYIKHF